jgi:acetylxylan esterase
MSLSKCEIRSPNEPVPSSVDSAFGFRISALFRISDFGLRISPFLCSTAAKLLLFACLGLFGPLSMDAASLQPVTNNWGTNGVPTNVTMYIYVPDKLATNPPILVLLHYWGGGASGVFAEAQGGGIVAAADQYGFIMVVPQNPDCWDYSSTKSLTHNGGGQTEAIAHMVNYTVTNYHANSNRVYVSGTSCGGMMTEAMLAVYPDIFKAGAEFAGVPVGGAWTPVSHTAQQWGDIVRGAYPGYAGPRPRVQLWHGTADDLVTYTNQLEAIMQWGNVLGLSTNPSSSNLLTILSITNQWIHQTWQDPCGDTVLDAWSEINGPHGTDANLNARYVIPFLGLDQLGPTDPVPVCTVVSAYSQVEAETYNSKSAGIQIESCSEGGQDLAGIQNGTYVAYKHVDFGGGAASFQARVASGASSGNIELHLDNLTGVQIGTCAVTNSGGWLTWTTQTRSVGGAAGVHDLYLKFTGGSGNLLNLNWWRFTSTAGVDIGTVGLSGSATSSNGVCAVAGAGADIQGSADAFHFVYVPVNGDCAMIARVTSVPNVNSWAKAGVMIRESLDPSAANALVAVTPANGVTWQCRTNTGGGTTYNNNGSLTAPYWVKLVRSGSTFTAYRSSDGSAWAQQGSTNITMASTAYVGLAVTSHTISSLCAATFDNVSAPGWLAAISPAPTGLVATASSSIQIKLGWNACANATGYNLKRSAISGGPYTTIATGIVNTNYSDSVASLTNGWYYVVSAVVAGSETPNSAEVAPQFLKFTGAIIGTSGSWNNSGATITNVFDNNLNTFFDGPTGNGCWAGLDFGAGTSNVITKINYCPRSGFESRMVNGIFQGANRADFGDAVVLFTMGTQPTAGAFTSANITNTAAFRYVRYLSPNNGYGNVSEVEFYGYQFAVSTQVPRPNLNLVTTNTNLTLSWPVQSAGFTLQSRTNLVSGDWMNIAAPAPQILGSQWQVQLPPPGGTNAVFFRLSK